MELYRQRGSELEDFWGRRENAPRYQRRVELFGRTVEVSANQEGLLDAVELCRPLYSEAPAGGEWVGRVQLVESAAATNPGPVPEDLIRHLHYAGQADWAALQAGAWGTAHVDLARAQARLVLQPSLAHRPDLVGACLLNTVFLNLFIGSGMGLLHASCLKKGEKLLLLVAPHNAGKSTTALRLVQAGYRLFTDSMIFLEKSHGELLLHAFPVGRVRLRQDAVAEFPWLQLHLRAEPVRGETKYSADLRELLPQAVERESLRPPKMVLCLLERLSGNKSQIWPARREELEQALFFNSLYYDTEEIWRNNLHLLEEVVDRAEGYHLRLGTEAEHMVETIGSL
jgi:hypothetical protein